VKTKTEFAKNSEEIRFPQGGTTIFHGILNKITYL